MESVIDALTYLHGQGLAHTRIKPGNILATGDQLKISSDTLCEIGGAPLVAAGKLHLRRTGNHGGAGFNSG